MQDYDPDLIEAADSHTPEQQGSLVGVRHGSEECLANVVWRRESWWKARAMGEEANGHPLVPPLALHRIVPAAQHADVAGTAQPQQAEGDGETERRCRAKVVLSAPSSPHKAVKPPPSSIRPTLPSCPAPLQSRPLPQVVLWTKIEGQQRRSSPHTRAEVRQEVKKIMP
eukprot:766963-Hanusia_phi.AAC.9